MRKAWELSSARHRILVLTPLSYKHFKAQKPVLRRMVCLQKRDTCRDIFSQYKILTNPCFYIHSVLLIAFKYKEILRKPSLRFTRHTNSLYKPLRQRHYTEGDSVEQLASDWRPVTLNTRACEQWQHCFWNRRSIRQAVLVFSIGMHAYAVRWCFFLYILVTINSESIIRSS